MSVETVTAKISSVLKDLLKVLLCFALSYALEWVALGSQIIFFGETSFAHVILIEVPFLGVVSAWIVMLIAVYSLEIKRLKECENARGS